MQTEGTQEKTRANGADLSASIRILELDIAGALQEIFDRKSLPVTMGNEAPRQGGLCEGVIQALKRRAQVGNDIFARHDLTFFAREKKITLNDSVDGRHVFVLTDFALPDERRLSPEAALFVQALATDAYVSLAQQAGYVAKHNGASSVHLLMPCYPYARQDKDHGERAPITAAITAKNLEPYYDGVTSVHLHAASIRGLFSTISLNNISPKEIYAPRFVCRAADSLTTIVQDELTIEGINKLFGKFCIVSPDAGGVLNARDFAKYCKTFAATLLGTDEDEIADIPMASIDKRRYGANRSEVMNILGKENVAGRICAIVDDMGDTFGTATHTATALHGAGAERVEFWGTHGYFSDPALQRIEASPIESVHITNTLALRASAQESLRTHVIDISPILAQVIIDQVSRPEPNLHIRERHLQGDCAQRQALGRYVFSMIPN